MAKRLIYLLAVILFPVICMASPFLVCDLPEAGFVITQSKIEITLNPGGSQTVTEVPGIAIIQETDFRLYDLAALAPGKYSFRVSWAEASGLWSDWSLPLPTGKPRKPGFIRIK